jgi:hypothetical protein
MSVRERAGRSKGRHFLSHFAPQEKRHFSRKKSRKRGEEQALVKCFEFTSKDATLQGDSAEIAATLNVKLWDSPMPAWSRATPY